MARTAGFPVACSQKAARDGIDHHWLLYCAPGSLGTDGEADLWKKRG